MYVNKCALASGISAKSLQMMCFCTLGIWKVYCAHEDGKEEGMKTGATMNEAKTRVESKAGQGVHLVRWASIEP